MNGIAFNPFRPSPRVPALATRKKCKTRKDMQDCPGDSALRSASQYGSNVNHSLQRIKNVYFHVFPIVTNLIYVSIKLYLFLIHSVKLLVWCFVWQQFCLLTYVFLGLWRNCDPQNIKGGVCTLAYHDEFDSFFRYYMIECKYEVFFIYVQFGIGSSPDEGKLAQVYLMFCPEWGRPGSPSSSHSFHYSHHELHARVTYAWM